MTAVAIQRHRTAILRRKFSRPVQMLLDDGILAQGVSFFDYGCGRGEDVAMLRRSGFQAAGFDPYFASEAEIRSAAVVNLGFVLNVIEDPVERQDALRRAFDLATDLLCVAVIAPDRNACLNQVYGDGVVTRWGTFQKYFEQAELFQFIVDVTGIHPLSAATGIAYVFKTDRFKDAFFQNRITGRSNELSSRLRDAENQAILEEFLARYHELGRPPTRSEFGQYGRVVRLFGSMDTAIESLRAEINLETVRENAARRKNAVIVGLCRQMIRKNGMPKFSEVDAALGADARLYFGSYDSALREARAHLQTLADLSAVSAYINQSPVGKVLPDDLYVHIDSLFATPDPLQILVELALMALPADVPYNVIKIARNSWHVSFLEYPMFHGEAHPALRGSMKVFLHKNQLYYRDYRESDNPPILHRKELFLHPDHPRFAEYSQLSLAEEEAGLLSTPNIGNRKHWSATLAAAGYRIEDHVLVRL